MPPFFVHYLFIKYLMIFAVRSYSLTIIDAAGYVLKEQRTAPGGSRQKGGYLWQLM